MTNQAHSGLLRKLFSSAAMRVGGAVISFLIVLLLAKGSDTEGLAVYHLLTTLAGFWLIASKFGLDTISLRLAARQESPVAKIMVVRESLRAALVPVSASLILLVLYLALFEPMIDADPLTVSFIALSFVAFTFLIIAIEYIRALEHQAMYSFIRFLLPNLIILAVVYISTTIPLTAASQWLTAYSPAFGRLVAALLAGAVVTMVFLRHARAAQAKGEIHTAPEKMQWEYVPVGIATTFVIALGFIAVKSIAVFGGKTDLAAHAVITRITYGLAVLTSTVSSLVAPRVSRMHGDSDALTSLFRFSWRLMLLAGSLFMVLVVLIGPWLLAFFNARFAAYYPELVVFSLAAVVNGIPFGQFMIQLDLEHAFARIMAAAAFVQLIGSAALGAVWGMLGIGIVAVIVAVFWNLACYIIIRKSGRIAP